MKVRWETWVAIWFVKWRPGYIRKSWKGFGKNLRPGWMCEFVTMKVIKKWQSEISQRVAVCGWQRGWAIMADRRWLKHDLTRMMKMVIGWECSEHENAEKSFKFIVSPIQMSDNGGLVLTKTMIGRECVNDKHENEKETFKFIVSLNRGVWVILPLNKTALLDYLV